MDSFVIGWIVLGLVWLPPIEFNLLFALGYPKMRQMLMNRGALLCLAAKSHGGLSGGEVQKLLLWDDVEAEGGF